MTAPTHCHLWQKEHLTKDDPCFDTVKVLEESNRLERRILKCKRCGQLYIYEFYEVVASERVNDNNYTTYIPIDEPDAEKLKHCSYSEGLQIEGRLQWKNNNKIVWVKKKE
jgi:hypothetical protein